ncbi:MAG TPA: hypothetical protein VLX28_15215 [Thermoanaerobaculia bacterium]|nr:hypothetical protein [Thermoanaerobaculia bacterium]
MPSLRFTRSFPMLLLLLVPAWVRAAEAPVPDLAWKAAGYREGEINLPQDAPTP